MDYQPTENQIWAQTLLFMVYQPMVANKTGRFPLSKIINQFPENEREKIKQGIDALVEMSIFVADGTDIYITNMSEAMFQGLHYISGKPTDEVEDILRKSPAFSSALDTINSDSRFAPPPETSPAVPLNTSASNAVPADETPRMSIGNKIFVGILLAFMLRGLTKVIFGY